VSLLYGFFGTLDVAVIAQGAADRLMTPGPDRLLVGIALFCVLCGIAFKISAVPFHFWCPDAFQGAKIEVTTWLSVASKAAGLVLLLRLVHAFSAHLPPGIVIAPAIVIGIIASITCTVGNLAALLADLGQADAGLFVDRARGYMMMAAAIFAAAAGVPAFPAISAVLAYIVVYLFMNLGAFGVTALVARANGGDDSLTAFSGLMRRAPGLAVPMLFCLISLVGIPPFAGFLAKYFLLMALGEVGGNLHYALIVVAVLNSLLSLWYYMRVVVQMMLKDSGEPVVRVPVAGNLLVNVCGVLLIVLLVFGSPLKRRVDQVAAGMYAKPVMTASAGDVAHSVNVDQSVPTE
jgi:NADH-quinone oxidoreductase subunit N